MSPSAFITRRKRKKGFTYVVRYRIAGREAPVHHAGSFKTMREAKIRRDWIAGALAAGRDPAAELEQLRNPKEAQTLESLVESYLAGRVDRAPQSLKQARSYLTKILPLLPTTTVDEMTPGDVNHVIGRLNQELVPTSVHRYLGEFRQLLDYAGLDPNPSRHRTIRLPRVVTDEPVPPTLEHFLAILDYLPSAIVLPAILMEQTAMRVGEVEALTWGDIDEAGARARVRARTAKARRSRWVQIPGWLMQLVVETCPPDDRVPDRRVFPKLRTNTVRMAMRRSCVAAKIPHYHPHDLRHRRLSLWHGQGVPARELSERAGHSKPSITLDVYSHTMPLDEASIGELEQKLVRSR